MLPNPLPDSYTLLTAIGAAKLANAFATSTPLVITEFAIGDANGGAYTPPIDSNDYVTQTELINEVYRDNILQKVIDPADPTLVKIRCQIPSDEGGYTIREVGLFDDDGDMIAIMINEQYKPAAGSGSTISVMNLTFLLHVANTATVTIGYTEAEYTDFSASTNTPPIASLTPGNSFLVITAGRLTGVAISGAIAGSDSVVLAGDIIKNINGQLQLISREINTVTSIPCGTGGLFTTLAAVNTYINQRRLNAVVSLNFNGTSTTTETASVNISHLDGKNLQILGTSGGTTFDFSGTSGNNLTISCDCYISAVGAKADFAASNAKAALQIYGNVIHDNGVRGENLSTGGAIISIGNLIASRTNPENINSTANITAITSTTSNAAFQCYGNGSASCYNMTTTGAVTNSVSDINILIFNNLSCDNLNMGQGKLYVRGVTTISGSITNGICAEVRFTGAVSCAGFYPGINCQIHFAATLNCTSYISGINSQIYHSGNVSNSGAFSVNPGASIYFLGTMSYTGAYTLQGGSTVYHAGNLIPSSGTFFATTSARAYYEGTKPTGYTGNTNNWLGNN